MDRTEKAENNRVGPDCAGLAQLHFSVPLFFHAGGKFTGTDRNEPYYRTGPDCEAVHSCNSWLGIIINIFTKIKL